MVKSLKGNIFSLTRLWVSRHDRASDFFLSSWQRGENVAPMLAARLVLSCLTVGILTWSLVEGGSPYWLIYLTNWGLLLITLMTLTGLFVSVKAARKQISPDTCELPWFVSTYWLLYNISMPLAVVITALYWALLFKPEEADTSDRHFWLDTMTHATNSAIAVTELLASRTPLRLTHIYQPLGVGMWYAAFTAIYYLAGGTDADGNPYVYEILNWETSSRAGGVVGASVAGLLAIYLTAWAVTLGRDSMSGCVVRTKSHDLPFTPPDAPQTRNV